ncbi:MAG: nitrilase-related carbon-nitrogen hydrolase, partial [Tepidiformaceae bacterium]
LRAFDIEDAEENLQNTLRSLDEAGAAGADLVLLPECSYPAYYLKDRRPYDRPDVRPYAEVAALLGAKAREHGYWLAAGLVVPSTSGALTNSGVMFSANGEMAGQYNKSFLWHFDNLWFKKGLDFPVFDTGFCRAGILICADGRLPEIARSLALNGAEIILDLTAWVASGRDSNTLSNIQCEYMMPVRAYENGVWVAAADKWGTEDGSIVYAGRSCVIDPAGMVRACAPSDQETVLVYEVDPGAPEGRIHRRPGLYRTLTAPSATLPIAALLGEPVATENSRVAVAPGLETFDARAMLARYEGLRLQGADLVVFPGMAAPDGWQVELSQLESACRELGGMLAFGASTNGCMHGRSATLVTPERSHEHTATHGQGITLGELPSPVVATPLGNVALLCGDEALVPEVARALMLEGAEILAWPLFTGDRMTEPVARTRSDENKVYVAAAWPDGGLVCAPNGSLVAASPDGSGVAMTASVNRAMARWKDMAPGTHVVNDRSPEAYGALTRQP